MNERAKIAHILIQYIQNKKKKFLSNTYVEDLFEHSHQND